MLKNRIVSGVLALALALTVVAPVAAGAQSMSAMSAYTFSSSLKLGSRGADVVALQSFLIAKGFLVMPAGVAQGYFGSLTKTAVAAYQSSKGITPAVGYFGPITMAAVAADWSAGTTTGGTTTPGCPSGAMYNSMTGQPCTTTTTGSTSTVGTVVSNPGEGIIDVRLAASPADNANIQTQTDVPVYGLEFRARQADVTVQRLDLQVDSFNQTSNASETPSTLINTIKIWDGSTVLATIPVTTGTFTKDSSERYYIRLTGFNFVVPKDVTKDLVVSFSTNSIDSTRVVTTKGYLTSSIRATDSTGVSTFYDASTLVRTDTFKKPGLSSLTLSSDPAVLRAQNYKLSLTDGANGVTMLTFNVKSQTGPSSITQVSASVNASGTAPTTLYLFDGSNLVSSKTVSGLQSTVTFDNLTVPVAQDQIKTLTVKADFSSATATGSAASTTINSVTFDQPNGSSGTVSTPVYGPEHRLFYAVPKFTLSSITTSNPTVGGNGSSSDSLYVQAIFTFNVSANGGTLTKQQPSDYTITVASSTGYSVTVPASSVTYTNNRDIADGGSDTVQVVARLPNASMPIHANTDFNFAISSIKWGFATQGASTTQTWGLEDYRSGPVTGSRA